MKKSGIFIILLLLIALLAVNSIFTVSKHRIHRGGANHVSHLGLDQIAQDHLRVI